MEQNKFFPEIQGRFGFGCMRLPQIGDDVNHGETCQMVDAFLDAGFNYFDIARVYLNGQNESAIREALVKRYPRDRFVLTNKLTGFLFSREDEILPLFEKQLADCGVDYFDFYLMHAQEHTNFAKYKRLGAYEKAFKLKAEGKIRHVGISFHDKASVLDQILTEYPQIELVQIQFNYLDYEDKSVESRKCYEVCEQHNVPVSIMEPVKGGNLVKLPPDAQAPLDELRARTGATGSNASYALRFVASFPNVCVALSGMSTLEQMQDNLSFMSKFEPLTEDEFATLRKVADILHSKSSIPCTGCKYCVDGCPRSLLIPDYFSTYNTYTLFNDPMAKSFYQYVLTMDKAKASDCIGCGKCEKACPQHLPIRQLLKQVAETMEA